MSPHSFLRHFFRVRLCLFLAGCVKGGDVVMFTTRWPYVPRHDTQTVADAIHLAILNVTHVVNLDITLENVA